MDDIVHRNVGEDENLIIPKEGSISGNFSILMRPAIEEGIITTKRIRMAIIIQSGLVPVKAGRNANTINRRESAAKSTLNTLKVFIVRRLICGIYRGYTNSEN